MIEAILHLYHPNLGHYMSSSLLRKIFNSPMGLVHVINHNLDTLTPNLAYYDQSTNRRVWASEEVINSNQVMVTLFIARALTVVVE